MNKKIKIGIFTAENISTSTGSTNTVLNLLNNLDANKYEVTIITIDSIIPTVMVLPESKISSLPDYEPFSKIKESKIVNNFFDIAEITINQLKQICEFAIVAVYNNFGEDGKILGLLELANIPYLSPSLKTSALCFDKQMTKTILNGNGIQTPKGFEVHKNEFNLEKIIDKINQELKFPVVVKTTSSGASRGVSISTNETELAAAANNAFQFSDEFLVEECLKGQEFTIGVTGDYLNPTALPVVEIVSANQFFDFEAKYAAGKAQEICPAEISTELTKKIQSLAIKTYQTIKASDHARIDIIFANNQLYVLEINTFPGLTKNSIFPKELKAMKIKLSSFIDEMIEKNRI